MTEEYSTFENGGAQWAPCSGGLQEFKSPPAFSDRWTTQKSSLKTRVEKMGGRVC